MRREIHAVEPTLAFLENQTMEDEVGMTLFPVRASAWLVSSIGLVAMLLAAVGLYGVIAYSVARRTREIGIRMALGARGATVVNSVLRQGLLIAALGLVAGVVGCYAVLRRRSLLGDALGHATLPGLCVGFLLAGERSLPLLLLGALVTSLAGLLIFVAVQRYLIQGWGAGGVKG